MKNVKDILVCKTHMALSVLGQGGEREGLGAVSTLLSAEGNDLFTSQWRQQQKTWTAWPRASPAVFNTPATQSIHPSECGKPPSCPRVATTPRLCAAMPRHGPSQETQPPQGLLGGNVLQKLLSRA